MDDHNMEDDNVVTIDLTHGLTPIQSAQVDDFLRNLQRSPEVGHPTDDYVIPETPTHSPPSSPNFHFPSPPSDDFDNESEIQSPPALPPSRGSTPELERSIILREQDDSDDNMDATDDNVNDHVNEVPRQLFPPRPMHQYSGDKEDIDDFIEGWERITGEHDMQENWLEEDNFDNCFSPFMGEEKTFVDGREPEDYFNFMVDTFWSELATQTNLYASRKLERLGGDVNARRSHADYQQHSRINHWKAVTEADIRHFAAHLILMGIVRKPEIESYWSTSEVLETPFFGKYMPRNRFTAILSNFHVADDIDNPPYDRRNPNNGHNPLAKLQPFVDLINRKFQAAFRPDRDISIDEGCCPWKGKLRFRQYNPRKPEKFHIKLYQISESKSGYVFGFKIYTGKGSCITPGATSTPQASTFHRVVMSLLSDCNLLRLGHHLYHDNLYTSPPLAEELDSKGTYSCGTSRDRKGMPEVLRKRTKLKLKVGECCFRRKGSMLAFKWEEKKTVCMLSTIHRAQEVDTGVRNRTSGEAIYKPSAVVDYTKYMGGVDLADQLMQYYHFMRRSCKWYRKLWVHLFNMVIMNCCILNNKFGKTKMCQATYREYLAKYLLRDAPVSLFSRRHRNLQPIPMAHMGHWPEKIVDGNGKNTRRQCNQCCVSKGKAQVLGIVAVRKTSTVQCSLCKIALCIFPCFAIFHNQRFGAVHQENGDDHDDM
jgi:hypothetical protein